MQIEKLNVKLTLTERILGSIPKNKEVYAQWIVGNMRQDLEKGLIDSDEFTRRSVQEVETVQETEEKGWTGFHMDENGFFIYDYVIRGFLKNAGLVLKDQMQIKAPKSGIDNFVFVKPRKIYFKRDSKAIHSVDGIVERPLRAQTMQGPRVTLVRSDHILEGATLEFELVILKNSKWTPALIKELFEYGQFCGLGQFRNGSYGRFTVEYPEK